MGRHLLLRSLCAGTDCLLAILVLLSVTVLLVGSTTRGAVATALGKSVLVVTSGSMTPALRVGDAIVADLDVDPADITTGDVIAYHDATTGVAVTHRVLQVATRPDGRPAFVTGGDANESPDSETVSHEQVIGRVEGRLPKVGFALAASHDAAVVSLFAAGSLLAHGALLIARTADPTGFGRRRGDSHHRKDNT